MKLKASQLARFSLHLSSIMTHGCHWPLSCWRSFSRRSAHLFILPETESSGRSLHAHGRQEHRRQSSKKKLTFKKRGTGDMTKTKLFAFAALLSFGMGSCGLAVAQDQDAAHARRTISSRTSHDHQPDASAWDCEARGSGDHSRRAAWCIRMMPAFALTLTTRFSFPPGASCLRLCRTTPLRRRRHRWLAFTK